jgi:hypothetical protein
MRFTHRFLANDFAYSSRRPPIPSHRFAPLQRPLRTSGGRYHMPECAPPRQPVYRVPSGSSLGSFSYPCTAAWRSFTDSLFLEARIVDRDALRLLIEPHFELPVLGIPQPALRIQHMLALRFVAVGRRTLCPLGEGRIDVTRWVVTARRRHHQVPAH